MDREVTLERFVFLPVDHADEMLAVRTALADAHRWFWFDIFRRTLFLSQPCQRGIGHPN